MLSRRYAGTRPSHPFFFVFVFVFVMVVVFVAVVLLDSRYMVHIHFFCLKIAIKCFHRHRAFLAKRSEASTAGIR